MHFKHPEILWFLFLLVIPILIHLFQLRRFRKEYFTNVKFLKELSIQTRKSSKLKKYLLLATRLLLLAALIIGFAQPFFNAKDSKNVTNEMYIVLDNSFSMQAKGQKGELMRRAVEDLLEHTPENQNFSLITNSDTYWNTDIKSIRKDLQSLDYSAAPFSLESAMAKIKSRKTAYNKDVIVITDAVALEENQLKSVDKDFNTYFIVPEAELKSNVSADSVFLNQTLDNFYEIGIKLSSYGEAKSVPVALYNNAGQGGAKLLAKTQISLDAKEKTILFTIPKEDFHGYVSIADNSLDYDNTLYFSISKPQKINVLSIGADDKSGFLAKLYRGSEFNFANFEPGALDYNIIDRQDAIVLNEIKDIPQALQTTLKSFVGKGGNLVVIPSQESSAANLNALMANFGNAKFGALQTGKQLVAKIAFNHPLYAAVFEKKIDNFQYPETKSFFPLSVSAPAALSFEDQSPFLVALQTPQSSVYVFAAPIGKDNSNFQQSPLIVPTFYNMVQHSGKTGISAIVIGENKPLLIDAALSKDEIVSVKNDREKFIPVQQALNNKVKMTFNDLPAQAGNFGVYKQDELLKNISFNYARTEGNLTANAELLSDFKTAASVDGVFNTLLSDRTNNEIWRLFVILALVFLVTELLIQKFVK